MPVTRYTVSGGEVLSLVRSGAQDGPRAGPAGQRRQGVLARSSYSASYWPYGENRSSSGSAPCALGYLGALGYYGDGAGRSHVRARALRRDLARWQTADPLWPRESAYGYAGGNPTTRTDPSGLMNLVPVDTKNLKAISTALGLINSTMSTLRQSQIVGLAFQACYIAVAMVRPGGRRFYSRAREIATGGRIKSVIPDGWDEVSAPNQDCVFDGVFKDAKATYKTLNRAYFRYQGLGFLDVLDRNAQCCNAKSYLEYGTTSDAVLGADMSTYSSRVLVAQFVALWDKDIKTGYEFYFRFKAGYPQYGATTFGPCRYGTGQGINPPGNPDPPLADL